MNCPICNRELVKAHQAESFVTLSCKIPYEHESLDPVTGYSIFETKYRSHYDIVYQFNEYGDNFFIGNENFFYDDVVIQKIYKRDNDFYWSIRLDSTKHIYLTETLFNRILSSQEFISRFKEFNPKDINIIRDWIDLHMTFK